MSKALREDAISFSDEQLVSFVKSGEYEYFDILLKRYMPRIKRYVRDYETVLEFDDLLNECCLAFFRAVIKYDSDKSAFGYFADYCVKKAVVSPYRDASALKRIPRDLISSIYEIDIVDDKNPESVFIEKESFNSFSTALKRILSDFEFDVLTAFTSGKSYKEIADETGKSVKSVDNALKRVREKIKRCI